MPTNYELNQGPWLTTQPLYYPVTKYDDTQDVTSMPNFHSPDLGSAPDSPFARDETGKLVRRMFWLDMGDQSLVLAMTQGIGTALTADEKRAHLADIGRDHLIDQICTQEILPPD
tara:strand:+ start:287 stop:631 length:345 start_codon:yes stop_codon:yes gene_type:complete